MFEEAIITGVFELGAAELIDYTKKQKWFKRLIDRFRKKYYVIVLGTTGTGKSNFLASLFSAYPDPIDVTDRTTTVLLTEARIGNTPFVFIDTPGHDGFSAILDKAIIGAVRKKRLIVINIVSYGYHEYSDKPSDKTKIFDTNGQVKPEYLDEQRKIEIAHLDRWTHMLTDQKTTKGLITVINKSDIWWNKDTNDVIFDHYNKGDYYQSLGVMKDFHPISVPYSSIIKPFYEVGNTSGQFNDPLRKKQHNFFNKKFLELTRNHTV